MNSSKKEQMRYAVELVNTMIQPIDTLFRKQVAVGNDPPPLFILGVPRSGTTLTYQVITQQLEVGYLTAPVNYFYGLSNLLTRLLKPWIGRPQEGFRSEYGNIRGLLSPGEHAHYWYQWFPSEGLLGHYVSPEDIDVTAYTPLVKSIGSLSTILNRPMAFKNVYLTMVSGVLARVFPDARFISVHRDPLLVCQSLLKKRIQMSSPDIWWSVKPPDYKEWLYFPLWKQVARQVFFTEHLLRKDLARYAVGRHIEVDYVELCNDPVGFVERVSDWLEPVGYERYPDMRVPTSFSASSELSMDEDLIKRIKDEFDFLEQKYGALIKL